APLHFHPSPSTLPPPPRPTHFPYTTLFRSPTRPANRPRSGTTETHATSNRPGPSSNPRRGASPSPAPPSSPARTAWLVPGSKSRSEEHTSELQSRGHLVCRLLLEKKNKNNN